ncbi:hypothetical protein PC113_g9898 [Phytophthora cactorum]|nr:hypothetical protein PC112_g9741 [Phytophthora cactorum]KAG2858354.1 hypothetical protein PC113_g9898 [Phytophthora cactorum]KAG2908140.1 hypothetical protein PC114_g10576 [Phytophthora cactorum]KAG2923331.1 hypothetical protein PC115_g8983 [Phytophthora cactorum]KAG2940846.1 hypothetical protein PC117_g10415 [Phytophthora cactorum]
MHLFYGATAAVTDTFRALANEENMKTLLLMAVVLSAFLHLLLLLIEGISMTFLSLEVVDATMRAFRYAAASTIQFLLIGVCRFFSVSRLENTFFAGSPRVTPNLSERLHQLGFGLVALVAKPLLVVLIPIAHFGHRYKKRSIVMDFVAVLEDVGEGASQPMGPPVGPPDVLASRSV